MSTTTARSRSTDQRYYGVAEAIVVDVADPAKEGRVRIKLPWFDEGSISDWCRVRQLYGGNGYGTFFVPEQGDEVLVAFVHGDMRFPIVLGSLYNGSDKPPVFRDASNDPKLIRTKGGHEVLLDDTSGKHKIVIKDSSNNNLITIDTVANTITIEAEQDITIRSKRGKLVLSGQAGVEMTSPSQVRIEGSTVNIN